MVFVGQKVIPYSPDMQHKLALMESLLFIVDKDVQLRRLRLNYIQRLLASQWHHRMLLCKYRQGGISTFILGLYFLEALLIDGLMVAIISHEDRATRRLIDKVDKFHEHLPDDMKVSMFHDSDAEKAFPNGSVIYIGTAGQRAFGRGDTVHRAHVSEEAHYPNAEKLIGGLQEAVPMSGYIVRESTPLGDTGYYYDEVQRCIDGKSDYRLIPLYWWFQQEYRIPRGSDLVLEQDRGELLYDKRESELVLAHGLDEEQIRWRRWKVRSLVSESKGNIFPQEYVEDLESCFIGGRNKVFEDVDGQIQSMSLGCREPLRVEGMLEVWRESEPGQRYVMWVDPCGGEGITSNDPHDGVVLRVHPGGLEHVASVNSIMEQRPFAFKVRDIAGRYNNALLVVERNGVGKGVLNYLVSDIGYKNLYPERKPNGELSGKWGWFTMESNKAMMVSDAIAAIRNGRVITYDRKLVRQLRALTVKDGKIVSAIHDDRAMAFMGAVCVASGADYSYGEELAVGDFVTFRRR